MGQTRSQRAGAALLWAYGLTVARFTIAFGLTLVLAHLLGPRPFGLVGVALLVVTPGMLLVEAGAGAALIQRDTVTPDVVASALTWQLLSGAVLSAATIALAPLIASLLHLSAATAVIRAMAPAFLLQSLGSAPSCGAAPT